MTESCTLPTYLSWSMDGDEGPWVTRVECDGPNPCGYSLDVESAPVPTAGGINSDEFNDYDREHRAYRRPPR